MENDNNDQADPSDCIASNSAPNADAGGKVDPPSAPIAVPNPIANRKRPAKKEEEEEEEEEDEFEETTDPLGPSTSEGPRKKKRVKIEYHKFLLARHEVKVMQDDVRSMRELVQGILGPETAEVVFKYKDLYERERRKATRLYMKFLRAKAEMNETSAGNSEEISKLKDRLADLECTMKRSKEASEFDAIKKVLMVKERKLTDVTRELQNLEYIYNIRMEEHMELVSQKCKCPCPANSQRLEVRVEELHEEILMSKVYKKIAEDGDLKRQIDMIADTIMVHERRRMEEGRFYNRKIEQMHHYYDERSKDHKSDIAGLERERDAALRRAAEIEGSGKTDLIQLDQLMRDQMYHKKRLYRENQQLKAELNEEKRKNALLSAEPNELYEELEREKKSGEGFRKRMYALGKVVQGRTEATAPMPWKTCQVCGFEFSLQPMKVPRVIGCGHTICTQCATTLADNTKEIRCPYCRKVHEMECEDISCLPKNFSVLDM
ncbi:unnamed protein product [Caenorhabditis sp. 36 PRJEB53466]|nr:unnamed protein product [Caenorhabditis sp. 36 PRJEB53466]